MKCEHMPEQLVSLLYDELDREEAQRVKSHLESCAACKQAYEELRSTSDTLEKWEDVTPKLNWVFVKQPESRWTAWKERFQSMGWGKRIAMGAPALAGIALILLAVFNFQAEFQDGEWRIAFSLRPRQETEIDAQIVETLGQLQTETLRLVSQMIEESEYNQQQRANTTLTRLAGELQNQRRQDLRVLGQGIEGLHQTTEGRYVQTQNALNDLIQLTGYKLERQK